MNIARVVLLLFFTIPVLAQRKPKKDNEDLDDSKYLGYGFTTNTHSGLLGGFVFRSSTPVSVSRKNNPIHRYIAFEAINIKHPKEYLKGTIQGTKYVYGKTNYLFVLRPEYGREWYFFTKNTENSIGLSGILAAGPSFGITKPYYIKYGGNGRNDVPQVVVYDPEVFVDQNQILGSASIWQGFLNNAGFIPGAHIKAAVNIDMSTFNNKITGFELGSTFELFSRSPEIISTKITSNPAAYASAYLTLYFGSKKLGKKKAN